MHVRITMARTAREIDLEIDDAVAFKKELDTVYSTETPLWWVTDVKGIELGLPVSQIGHIEIEDTSAARSVGFA